MNKTVTANINGIVFHIEIDAYEKLKKYLTAIRGYFQGTEGEEEIMADIEARIAELFKSEGKDVINMQQVNHVIEVMGEPEQYMDQDTENGNQNQTINVSYQAKKLYRDSDDGIFGGVCSGLGYFFGIDRLWFRAAFLIAVIAGFGTGLIVYIIFWIIVPSAKNTSEKLEMKGEPVNVSNIGNSIKEEFDSFKKKVNDNDSRGIWQKIRHTFLRIVDLLGKLIFYAIKFVGKTLSVFLLLISVVILMSLLAVAFSAPFDIQLDEVTIQAIHWSALSDLFFRSILLFRVLSIGILLFVLLPVLALAFISFKALFKVPGSSKTFSLATTALWIIAIIAIFVGSTWTIAEFSSQHRVEEKKILDSLNSDTLILEAMARDFDQLETLPGIWIEDQNIYQERITVDILQTKSDQVQLRLKKSSRGRSRDIARNNAKETYIDYELNESQLSISPYWWTPIKHKFRAQTMKVYLELPIGKVVYLAPSIRPLIYGIENVTNTYDGDMIGHHWLMTKEGLKCLDCQWLEEDENGAKASSASIVINI